MNDAGKTSSERHIKASDEAHWMGETRLWVAVQQFPPRRPSFTGHIIAAIIGALIAVLVIVMEISK